MSSFLEICQMARQECGMGGAGPANTTGQTGAMAVVVDRTSKAWIDIQKSRPYWKFLRALLSYTLTVDQNSYVVADSTTGSPPGFGLNTVDKWDIQSCWIFAADGSNRSRLLYMPYQNFRSNFPIYQSGRPGYFTDGPDGTIIFDKTPDVAYLLEMDYWQTPEKLVNSTDIPALPEQFHDIIAWKSVMKVAGSEGAAELYTYAKSEYGPMFIQLCIDQLDMPKTNHSYPMALGRRAGDRTFEEAR